MSGMRNEALLTRLIDFEIRLDRVYLTPGFSFDIH